LGKGVSTAWRDVRTDPDFPKPIRLSAGCTRFKVGDIRAYLAKKVNASAKPKRSQRMKGQVTP
jgi:prophage regulatory protein